MADSNSSHCGHPGHVPPDISPSPASAKLQPAAMLPPLPGTDAVTFRLLLLRHATPEDPPLVSPDAWRGLTGKARRPAPTGGQAGPRPAPPPPQLLSSPLVRAVETATLLSQHLPDCPLPQVVDWLALGTPTGIALAALQEQVATAGATDNTAGPLCLVGHEPDLSALISRLLGADTPIVHIRKASLTALELSPSGGTGTTPARLLWSIPCGLMR